MAIARVGQIGSTVDRFTDGSNQVTITVGVAGVAAGSTVVLAIGTNSATATITGIVDSNINTYTVHKTQANVGNVESSYLASGDIDVALVNGDTITITFSSGVGVVAYADEWSGLAASPIDRTASGNSGFGNSHTSGSTATTTQADELLIGVHVHNQAATWTATSSFNLIHEGLGVTAGRRLAYQYRIVSATGAYASTGTTDNNTDTANIIGTFTAPAPPPQSFDGIGTFRTDRIRSRRTSW